MEESQSETGVEIDLNGGTANKELETRDKEKNPAGSRKRKKSKSCHRNRPAQKKPKTIERKGKELFVRNIPQGSTEEDVRGAFGGRGIEVTRIKLKGRSGKKTALLMLEREIGEVEVSGLVGIIVRDSTITVELYGKSGYPPMKKKRRSNKRNKCRLFAGHLAAGSTADILKTTFGCQTVRMPKNTDGSLKGFAFLEFSSEKEAEEALRELQGVTIQGKKMRLERVMDKKVEAVAEEEKVSDLPEDDKVILLD